MKIAIPCLKVKMVPWAKVRANNYNPNHVPKEKMELLKQSIIDNGMCFPIVTIYDDVEDVFVIVDGFHRYTVCGPEWLNMPEIPIVVLEHDLSQRMAATVQFNKARGVHELEGDADIVKALTEQGLTDDEISKHLGMDLETIHRYKSLTGIAELFANTPWGKAWEVDTPETADFDEMEG